MQETVKKVLSGDFNKKKALWFLLTALVTVIVWNLPSGVFGIDGLTVVHQRPSPPGPRLSPSSLCCSSS